MSDSSNDAPASRHDPAADPKLEQLTPDAALESDDFDREGSAEQVSSQATGTPTTQPSSLALTGVMPKTKAPLAMVETAFLASTASLIWLINYYFPLGPILRMFFPVPIALVYLRWGHRASWMAALVSGLLLSVLMGPTRSILFFIPYGVMGVQLGAFWRRGAPWLFSITTGTLLGTLGFFLSFGCSRFFWVRTCGFM